MAPSKQNAATCQESLMATTSDVLIDAFGRIAETVRHTADGLDEATLTARLDPGANTIAWLLWHQSRVQDDHIADLAGTEQRWTAGGWADRFGLPFDVSTIGYGQSSDDVAAVRGVPAELLVGYADDVHDATVAYLRKVDAEELDRVIDSSWDPPVTAGVRLVSVISDCLQHVGQAAFVRGVVGRR
jgi:hypothetical protein